MTSNLHGRPSVKSFATGAALIILAVASVLGITVANIRYARNNPGGTDFLVAWEGMRSVVKGENPYTDATALRIQLRAYGRPAVSGENELRVPYPIYALLFLAPLSLTTDFSVARGIWMTIVELSTIGFALISTRLSGKIWKPWQLAIIFLFSFTWYFGLRAIINGNVVILVSLFFALALYCLKKNWDWAAGVIFVLATIKPQVALFPIACFIIWGLFARRYKAVLAFFTTIIFFVVVGLFLLPTWLTDDLREVMRYPSYNPPGNPESSLRAIFGAPGSWAGVAISLGALALMLILWARLPKAKWEAFLGIFAMTLILSPLSGLQTDAGNEYILLLPVALVLVSSQGGWIGPRSRFVLVVSILFFGLWGLFLATVQRSNQPVQHPIMLFPLPVFLFLIIGWNWISEQSPSGPCHGVRLKSGMVFPNRMQ